MKDLKVCLVSDTVYDVNGVSRFIQDCAKEGKKLNKNFLVITSTKKEHYESLENIKNLKPFFTIKMPFYKSLDLVFPNFFKIKKELKKQKPDLLHISTPGPVGLCALLSAKLLKIPVVGIYHTDFPSYLYKNTKSKAVEKFVKWYLKKFYKNYKAIFSRTQEYKKIVCEDLKFCKTKVYTLKAGINTNTFSPLFEDQTIWNDYEIKKDAFKILYVGRISVEKNVDKLLKFWEKANIENSKLILVGDIEFKIDQKELLKKGVYFLGRKQKEELSKIYASSDCFVFPSTTDTLGQVVMEALASRKPVIVTNKGGPKSFVNEEFGYILDIEDEDSWIEALNQLSKKDEQYLNKAKLAYEFIQGQTISKSFEDFWKKNEIIYQNLNLG